MQQNSFVDIDSYSEYDRQARMLAMIRKYEDECRAAQQRGGTLAELFSVPAREKIGRAKSVPADRYVEAYAQLVRQMEEQISAVAEKGEEAL